jgi:hypothetical protein
MAPWKITLPKGTLSNDIQHNGTECCSAGFFPSDINEATVFWRHNIHPKTAKFNNLQARNELEFETRDYNYIVARLQEIKNNPNRARTNVIIPFMVVVYDCC